MTDLTPGLGTQLRRLIELLDDGVSAAHGYENIGWRPRFTPVMRALAAGEALTIGELAQAAGLTQPAATQTVALMARAGFVKVAPGRDDARRRVVRLAPAGARLLPRLQAAWETTRRAAEELDAELPHPLSQAVAQALAALERRPMARRIADAACAAGRGADPTNEPAPAPSRRRKTPRA